MSNGVASHSIAPLEWPTARDFTGDRADLEDLQQALFEAIWGIKIPARTTPSGLTNYYLARVNLIDPRELAVVKHIDIIEIVDFVRDRPLLSRLEVRNDLRSLSPRWLGQSSASPDTAIDLVIRLWLLSDPSSFQNDDCVLTERLSQLFPRAGSKAPFEEFELQFDAGFFEKVAGITVIGTQCLTNHLRYDRKNKTLTVFDAADFLTCNRDQGDQKLFPAGLLVETQRTLALLFPQGRFDSNGTVPRRLHPDIEMAVFGQSSDLHDPDSYVYWRERLMILHSAYSKTQPGKMIQFWRDRRDTTQWTTLWLAVLVIVLTLVFGLIQSITGILQVMIAYRQSQQQ